MIHTSNTLLAQEPMSHYDALRSIRDAFSHSGDYNSLIIALAVFVGALVLLMLVDRRLRGERRIKTVDYLTVAVDLLELSESERRDLRALVKRGGIEEPASILLSPANLLRALDAAEAHQADARLHARVLALGERLFGHPLHKQRPPRGPAPGRAVRS